MFSMLTSECAYATLPLARDTEPRPPRTIGHAVVTVSM
jgi:hypothetical protein